MRSLSKLKNLDSFLNEEGIREEVTETALKRVMVAASREPLNVYVRRETISSRVAPDEKETN